MGFHLKKGMVFLVSVTVGIIVVPFLYLNCSGSSTAGSSDAASVIASGVFPYQMHVDTIAYMSCSDLNGSSTNTQTDPTNTFFSFKVGVNNINNCDAKPGSDSSGCGVSLTAPFANAVNNLSLADKTAVLESSTFENLYPDLSIRPNSDLINGGSAAYISTGCTTDCGIQSFADANLLGPSSLLSSFVSIFYSANETDWHNSISTSTGDIPLSGQISFTGGQFDGAGIAIRNAIAQGSGSWFLTTEFATAAGVGQPGQGVSSDGSNTHVYGYGYRFTFTNGQYQPTGPARAIATNGVTEYDLTTGQQTGSTWTCENFEILYPGDINRSTGGVPPWNPLVNPQPANALQAAVQQTLPNWQFDEYGNFVVPPSSVTSGDFCNGNLQMQSPGSYTPSNTLYYGSSQNGGGTCSATGNNCPHLISVCIRN